MRGAGCVVNDLWDRDLDRRVERTRGRPLAAGTVRRGRGAGVPGGAAAWSGWLVLLQLNPRGDRCSASRPLLPIVLYPLAKRVTNWPQAMLGLTFSWAAPTGMAAATGGLGRGPSALWAAGVLLDARLRHDLRAPGPRGRRAGRHRLHGAALRGADAALPRRLLRRDARAAGAGRAGWPGCRPWFWPALLLPAALLARQVATLDIHDPAHCLRLFKSNREVGLAVALAFLLGRL